MKKEGENIRLSFDATSVLGVKENILEVSDEQALEWLKGQDIQSNEDLKGVIAIKNKGNFLGVGKAGQGRITNFVPKDRRLRS